MLSLNFNIRNPWSQKFNTLWCRAYSTPLAHKYIELEVYQDSSVLGFNINVTARQSHAGLDLDVGLLGYCVHFNLYDHRHWNSAAGRYYKYSEEQGEH